MGDPLKDDVGDCLGDFLRQASGRPFCDGCLAIELRVERLEVQSALDDCAKPTDRGHGRCAACGQTLTVTRVSTE